MKDIFKETFEKRYWYDYLFDGDNLQKREGFNLEDVLQFYEVEKEFNTGE
jgi:hypothetical protein